MARFSQMLSWLENTFAAITLGAAAIITITNVILRTFFKYSLFWGEEAVVYLIIYSVFIGASIALRHNEHVGVDIVSNLFKDKGKWVLKLLSAVLLIVYCLAFGVFAWRMVTEPAAHSTFTPALKLPVWTVHLAVPIGMTLLLLRALELLYRVARYNQGFPDEEPGQVKDGGI